MSLEQVIEASTIKAANAIKLEGIGTLEVGAHGDIATWTIDEGDFTFADVAMNVRKGNQLLVNQATFIAGELLPHMEERPLHKWAGLPDHQRGQVIPVRPVQ
jgi:dihydroorotase